MIKIEPITSYYAITKIPNFKKHKKILLKYFEEMEGAPFDKDRQDISKTDWNFQDQNHHDFFSYNEFRRRLFYKY